MSKRFNTRTIVEAGVMIALAALLGRLMLFRAPMGGKVTPGSMIPLLLIAMLRGPVVGVLVGAAYGVINFLIGGSSPVSIIQWLLDYPVAYAALGVAGFFWLPRIRKMALRGGTEEHAVVSTLDVLTPPLVLALGTFILALVGGGFFGGEKSFLEALQGADIARCIEFGGLIALFSALTGNLARRLPSLNYFLPVAGAFVGIGLRMFSHILSGVWFFGQYAPEGVSPWVYSLSYNAQYMIPEIIISGFILVYLAPTVMKFLRQRAD